LGFQVREKVILGDPLGYVPFSRDLGCKNMPKIDCSSQKCWILSLSLGRNPKNPCSA
jgi:hypothetical protein